MKRFRIRSYGEDFFTGVTSDGRLALLGLFCPDLVVVYFDRDGAKLTHENRSLSMQPPQFGATSVSWETDSGTESIDGLRVGPFNIYDPVFRKSLEKDLEAVKAEIGFTECAIDVQQFDLEGHFIGIDLLPGHLAEFKDDPDAAPDDEEERRELQESLRDWEESGDFVFWWGKDYWFNADGEVEST